MTNSHAKSILNAMNALRKSNTLCDVTLRVEHKDFPAHRIVLAACSDYFCAMFTSEVGAAAGPGCSVGGGGRAAQSLGCSLLSCSAAGPPSPRGGPGSPCGHPGVHGILPVIAQDAPVVVLVPFMVAVGASGTPVVALDYSMVALGHCESLHAGPGALWVLSWWPWSLS
ncbi:hypothetical protein DV515_00019150, partial [Chloebia gouldiae]